MNKHIIITGTGRAGTSFLVQYLHENGFETHLSRNPDSVLDDISNAGLEDFPLPSAKENLPYIIKSPWLSFRPKEHIPKDFEIDALIIPVRSLADSAESRILNEAVAMYRSAPWMDELPSCFEHWSHVPGGVVFALDPVDQARILATAFHEIVEYAVQNEIPLIFLDFPRFISDSDYLFAKLSSVVKLDEDFSKKVHTSLADVSKIRVGKNLNASKGRNVKEILASARERAHEINLNKLRVEGTLSSHNNEAEQKDASKKDYCDLSGLSLFEILSGWYKSRKVSGRR